MESSLRNKVEKFVLISTDEVLGDLDEGSFLEDANYHPNNPYASTKAAAEHLVNNFKRSFNLNINITRCTNNFGPRQHSEKLIPSGIKNLKENKPIQIHGKGNNIRSWIYVLDHCIALEKVMSNGISGETYHIPGIVEKSNMEIANDICNYLSKDPEKFIEHVEDRPGNDTRYSLATSKEELNLLPKIPFNDALNHTIAYYENKFKHQGVTSSSKIYA